MSEYVSSMDDFSKKFSFVDFVGFSIDKESTFYCEIGFGEKYNFTTN